MTSVMHIDRDQLVEMLRKEMDVRNRMVLVIGYILLAALVVYGFFTDLVLGIFILIFVVVIIVLLQRSRKKTEPGSIRIQESLHGAPPYTVRVILDDDGICWNINDEKPREAAYSEITFCIEMEWGISIVLKGSLDLIPVQFQNGDMRRFLESKNITFK